MMLDLDIKCLQDKLESLLQETDEICRDNDINYFLIEEALSSAVRGIDLPGERRFFSVAIYSEDVERFIAAACSREGRAVESLLNNRNFPGFYLKYVDINTTLYNVSETRREYIYNSIGINICVLLNKQKNNKKSIISNNKMQKTWAKLIARNSRSIKKSLFLAVYGALGIVFNNSKSFEKYLANNKTTKSKVIFLPNGDCVSLPEDNFGKGEDVCINNYMYRAPDKAEAVALKTNRNGLSLKRSKNPYAVNSKDIVSFSYAGTDYMAGLKNKGISTKKCGLKYSRYQRWRKNRYLPVWQKREENYSYYNLTRDRFYLYDKLAVPYKEEIIFLYNNGRFEELYDILHEYIELLIQYDEEQMGLFFDKEIYVITIKVIEHLINKKEKNDKFSQDIKKKLYKNINKVFWQHLQPIDQFTNEEPVSRDEMEEIRERIRAEISEN